jgi:hypothetical protein
LYSFTTIYFNAKIAKKAKKKPHDQQVNKDKIIKNTSFISCLS